MCEDAICRGASQRWVCRSLQAGAPLDADRTSTLAPKRIMFIALVGLLTVHGLIHLIGFAKAFGYAALPQLTQPISREWGMLWLLGSGLVVATAVTRPRNAHVLDRRRAGASRFAAAHHDGMARRLGRHRG